MEDEQDLGVITDRTLKLSKQCMKPADAAHTVLGMIQRTFLCNNKELMIQLYKTLIRPKLDYCMDWRPCLKKDISILELVQGGQDDYWISIIQVLTGLHYTGNEKT